MNSSQSGFSHAVGVAVIVVVFTIVGFIGYKLYANPLHGDGAGLGQAGLLSQGDSATGGIDASAAPTIRSESDLERAGAVLDQIDTNAESASDVSQLNSQLNGF